MRYAQLVMGPAGSGKSSYCSALAVHAQTVKRALQIVNLDPAAEHFGYEPLADIRELIHVDDAMEDEELHYGPNGALVYCMEYLVHNFDWLEEQLGNVDDDYILFDCPGQIELFTHLDVMKKLVDTLQSWDFHVCGIFILDSQFMVEPSKFLSGTLTALSVMVNLEIPHVNVLSKMDLVGKKAKKEIHRFLEPDVHLLLSDEQAPQKFSENYQKLSETIGRLLDDYSLVKFLPLNIKDEESIQDLLEIIDQSIQYGEDLDVRTKDFDEDVPND